jgi:signal transduction histidine kinase
LCRFLRNSPQHAETPIVLLTALGESLDRFWGHHCGASRYLVKGGPREELLQAVEELLEASAARRQEPRLAARQWLGRSTVSEQVAGMMDRLLREATLREEIGKLGRSAASLSDFLGSSLELLAQFELFDAAALMLRFDDHLRVATWRLAPSERPAVLELLASGEPSCSLQPTAYSLGEGAARAEVDWVDFEPVAAQLPAAGSHQTVALESGGQRFGLVAMIRRQPAVDFRPAEYRRLQSFCREFEGLAAVAWGRETVARKNRQLVELTGMKDRLSELLVHDVKNAAWAVSMTLDLLSTDRDLSEQNRRALKEAHVGCRLLTEMMVSLLDIAKMEQTGLPLAPGPIDCNALAREVLELHEGRARRRQVEVRLENLPMAFGDAELVRRVLSNLLGNAVKHTTKGRIVIESPSDSADVNNGEVIIAVGDTGPGIEERFLRVLFEKYTQAEKNRPGPGGRGGLPLDRGLGLYFCRMAVEAHGGRIWAESRLGQGSVFKFTLPADAAAFERQRRV